MTALNQVKSMMVQLTRGRNRHELLNAEKQQTESDPFKQKESLRKEYSSTAQVNAAGK